jgi:hypothetical protein
MPPCTKQGPYRNSLSRSVEELDWPAQSPDLNLKEHLLDELEWRLRARPKCPTSMSDLTNVLVAEFRMEANPCSNVPTSSGKLSQNSGGCYSSKGRTISILMPSKPDNEISKQQMKQMCWAIDWYRHVDPTSKPYTQYLPMKPWSTVYRGSMPLFLVKQSPVSDHLLKYNDIFFSS